MRIFNTDTISILLGAALSLGLGAGAAAQATTDSQTAAPPAAQTAPEQTPATQPPTAPPSAQTSPQQGTAQQGGPNSIDEELQLTEDQKQKIATIVDGENKQISALRDDNSMTMDQKRQKLTEIRQTATPKIKAILTPEQLQKLAVIQQRMRDQQQQGSPEPPSQQNSAPSGPQSSPPTAPQGSGH